MTGAPVPTTVESLSGMSVNSLKRREFYLRPVVLSLAGPSRRDYVPRDTGGIPMADRMTAMDVENQEFARKMRGYDPDEVDLFLKAVAGELERLTLDNGTLREELGTVRRELSELKGREQALQDTLVTAQSVSDDIKTKARGEADLVLDRAKLDAERLLQQARQDLAALEAEIGRLRVERETFETRLRSVIDQHLTMLDLRRESRGEMDNLRVMPTVTGSETG